MQLMKPSEKKKYLTSEHRGPKLNKPLNDIQLCATTLHVKPQHLESIYWISVSKIVETSCRKLVDKLEQIKAEEAIGKEAEVKIYISCKELYLGSASNSVSTEEPEGENLAKKHERRHCKWYKQKSHIFWLHNTSEDTCYNAYLTSVHPRDIEKRAHLHII